MTQDQVIAAAREAGFNACNGFSLLIVRHGNGSWIDIAEELGRFYAIAHKAGMERAAEICDDLPAPASCSGSERSLWDVASTEIADAIRAEAHAQNQPIGTHKEGA